MAPTDPRLAVVGTTILWYAKRPQGMVDRSVVIALAASLASPRILFVAMGAAADILLDDPKGSCASGCGCLFVMLLVLGVIGAIGEARGDRGDDNGGSAELPDFAAGTWEGTLEQDGDSYPVVLELYEPQDDAEAGTIAYPSLECSGTLELQDVHAGQIVVYEYLTVNEGQCVDGGEIELTFITRNELSYFYDGTAHDTADTAGTLSRNP